MHNEDLEFLQVKDIFKRSLNDIMQQSLGLKYAVDSLFMVEVDVKHSESNEDYQLLTKIPTCEFQVKTARKKNGQLVVHGASTDKIFKALEKLESKDLEPHSLFPLPMISKQAFIQVTGTSHNQIYIGGTLYTINFYPGRYCKLQRHISHSKWEIDGKRLASESVEETISPFVCQHLGAASHKFASSGREDSDVRMLGTGRPFYIEIKDPKVPFPEPNELLKIQEQINSHANGKVQVQDLTLIDKEQVRVMTDSISSKSKTYSVLVRLSSRVPSEKLDEINKLQDLAIEQRNPTRVPRRSDLIRQKVIENITCRIASPKDQDQFLKHGAPTVAVGSNENGDPNIPLDSSERTMDIVVEMQTSAGTYVKEFVHGDGGRTKPWLGDLLGVERADVLALDVMKIHLEWPCML